ncbi:MAG TPA: Nif3-like dinuclear metal center hexameric protein, partial [Arcobacter sp.]|nr:Nif3-like dinuclear metal center hexameric protein [Arcobacter sp.]
MKIKEIINELQQIAPPIYQESYDNAGLIVGDAQASITGILICLDSTEAIVDEAIEKGCNMIIAHHPIVFGGLKRFTGSNYVQRTVIKAIKNDIAIYAIHTNLDNMYSKGVNEKFAQKLGLVNTRILTPKKVKKLIEIWLPEENHTIQKELKEVGFNPLLTQNRLSVAFDIAQKGSLMNILNKHQINSDHYQILASENTSHEIGAGMIGELPEAIPELEFLKSLKQNMQTGCVRYTPLLGKPIKKVAICGGSGSFLLRNAIQNKADIFITGDFKYHEFFDAENRIIIADIGHFE